MDKYLSKIHVIAIFVTAIIAAASIFYACSKENEKEFNDKTTQKSFYFEEQNAIALANAKIFETSEIESIVNKDELKEFFENKSQNYLGEQIFLIDFQIIDYEIENPDHQPFCEITISDQHSDNHIITIPISKFYDLSNTLCIFYIEDMNIALDNEWDLAISEFTFNAIRVIYKNQNHETEPINGVFTSILFNEAISTITIENSEIIGSKLTFNGKPITHNVPERRPFKVLDDAVKFMVEQKVIHGYDCVSLTIYEDEGANPFGPSSKTTTFVVEYDNKDKNGCCWYDIDCINFHNNH